ncbi:hypothetical protein LEP1GSC170_4360 [Leptospira interrogans serovar Bataviae str. HAI135]|nr:hypothetical protein LEP1GSC170_4360 [Leptospira interrogans serovar Bataviae str. HAI135]
MEDFDDLPAHFQIEVDSAILKEIPISLITYVLTPKGEKS